MKRTGRLVSGRHAAALALLALLLPAPAGAQDEQGATVGAAASAASLESTTAFSFSGSGGYQFSRNLALEIEATAVQGLKSRIADRPTILSAFDLQAALVGTGLTPVIFPTPTFRSVDGRAVFFTTNVRAQLPTPSARLTPFFVAGGGAANLRHTIEINFPRPLLPAGVLIPIRLPQRVVDSTTNLALTIGGGVDVRIASRAAVTADLRYFRLFGEQDSNVGRFGVGVRYRF
jgi:opacity protein-like surface antigen